MDGIRQIEAENIVRLWQSTETDFVRLVKELNVFDNVKRLSGTDISVKYDIQYLSLSDQQSQSLFFYRVRVKGKIQMSGSLIDSVPVIWLQSELDGLSLSAFKGKNFYVNECKLSQLEILNNSLIGNFRFSTNCEIGNISVANSQLDDLEVSNSIWAGMSFRNSKMMRLRIFNSAAEGFLFERSRINSIDLATSSVKGIDIYNASEVGNIEVIDNSTVGHFRVKKSNIDDVRIWTKSVIGNFKLSEGSNAKDFVIDRSCTSGDFVFDNCSAREFNAEGQYSSFVFESAEILRLTLKECDIPVLKLGQNCRITIDVLRGKINVIDFRFSRLSKESIVSFSEVSLYVLLFEQFIMHGNLYFRSANRAPRVFDWFKIEDRFFPPRFDELFHIEGKVFQKMIDFREAILKQQKTSYDKAVLTSLNEYTRATLRIIHTSLGKTEFTNCSLAEFRFEFDSSKITECFIIGSSMPDKNVVIFKAEEGSTEWHYQKALFYIQLKKIFEGQGDVYSATLFQSKWAKHQESELRLRLKSSSSRFKCLSDVAQDYYTFWFNKISNKHGESWLKAVIYVFIVGTIFYIPFLWSIGRCFIDTDFDWNLVGYFFEFINPVHKINFVDPTLSPTGLSVTLDFLGRVFVGYGIYQFIAAFRRHGKK